MLYIYYNSDLLEIPKKSELRLGFIDDIGYGTSRPTAEGNAAQLRTMLEEVEV